MKKSSLFTVATCLLVMVSCEKEQSQFVLENLSNTCKVQGVVKYDAGYTVDGNGVILSKNIGPKAGAQVILSVPYNDYASGDGDKQYFATTDAEGKYSFNVPVGAKALANAKVEVVAFEAAKGFLVDNKVASVSKAVYNTGNDKQAVAIEANKIRVNDFTITSDATLNPNQLDGWKKFTVSGIVKLDAAKWKSDKVIDGGERTTLVPPTSTKVRLTLTNISDASAATITYTTNVGEGGIYSLSVPFFNAWSYNDVKVEAEVVAFYAGASLVDYQFRNLYTSSDDASAQQTQRLTGVYEMVKGNNTVVTGELVTELGLKIADLTMLFTPDDQAIRGYSIINWLDGDTKRSYTNATPSACMVNWSKNNTMGKYNQY